MVELMPATFVRQDEQFVMSTSFAHLKEVDMTNLELICFAK
jgi:hypothetical protein